MSSGAVAGAEVSLWESAPQQRIIITHCDIYLIQSFMHIFKMGDSFQPFFFLKICLFVNIFDGWEKLDGRLFLCRAMI